ncbi:MULTISPECIES: hypothetical protein [unclassified Clostridium]|uniref:hypothetical protein n=1 Tax=unclassified Clostridium TaxID=2614128 RepID=UPI0025BDC8D0|nr:MULTISPECIES: hypothetical protein [unclassified Clostridium]
MTELKAGQLVKIVDEVPSNRTLLEFIGSMEEHLGKIVTIDGVFEKCVTLKEDVYGFS